MDLILKNYATSQKRIIKNVINLYGLLLLLPIIGLIALLFISIRKKQTKIWISFFIAQLIMLIIYLITVSLAIILENYILIPILTVTIIYFFISMFVLISLNINYWSYNEYIYEGYKVANTQDLTVQIFMTKAKTQKKPFWILFI